MQIIMEFIGMAKQHNDWRDTKEIELPEGSTTRDALLLFNLELEGAKGVEFLVINDVIAKKEEILNDGDYVKVFPRAFGG